MDKNALLKLKAMFLLVKQNPGLALPWITLGVIKINRKEAFVQMMCYKTVS